jgi:ABC-type molybdate transport system substrate-binding protein
LKLIQRIGYYLGGFSLGLIILAFFLNGKKTSCAYGPEARVLKNINTKPLVYAENIIVLINTKSIDSLSINKALKKGNVIFSESDTRQEPCGVYAINSYINDSEITLTVENCDSIATLQNIKWK